MTKPGTVDNDHLVSAVDLLPTLLDLLGLQNPGKMDGKSFVPLLRGEAKPIRDFVIKEYNENSGGSRDPMRAIETKKFLYIFNPWSNGERIMATATTGTPTYRRMAELAKTEVTLEARHKLYQFRVPEELYDIEKDPGCLNNLIHSPAHAAELNQMRATLEQWMIETKDGMLDVFRNREDAAAREAYVAAQEKEAEDRRANERKVRRKAKAKGKEAAKTSPTPDQPKAATKKHQNMISLVLPEAPKAGARVTLKVRHQLPPDLGEQVLTVTLKDGNNGGRIERKAVKARGDGVVEISFNLPAKVPNEKISFAAFVGEDFQTSLQRVQSDNISIR